MLKLYHWQYIGDREEENIIVLANNIKEARKLAEKEYIYNLDLKDIPKVYTKPKAIEISYSE
jgi:hypothetical protein